MDLDAPITPDSHRGARKDNQGHPMSSWDNHTACHSCLRSVGQVCSRSSPCNICRDWTDKMWCATESAERRSEVKRQARLKKRQAKALPDASLMPPPSGAPRRSRKPREEKSAGEDAEWSPVESPRGSLPKVGANAPTSTPKPAKSARPAQAVKANLGLESAKPAQAVKADSCVVWVDISTQLTLPVT